MFHDHLNTIKCKNMSFFSSSSHFSFIKIIFFSKRSYVYIHHIVWYCDTCFSIVYGNRRQNSSLMQLYEIFNERIILKSKYIEETKRGYLLPRYLKPYFYSYGTYAYIIHYDLLNIGKSKQKSYPYVVRIYLNQSVCFNCLISKKDFHKIF